MATNQTYRISCILLIFIVSGIFLILISPYLLSEGMFMDGIIYAAISHNLAHDIGSFWAPKFTAPSPIFYGHPPLAFGIQSVLYSIFGDSFLIEKIYSFSTIIIACFLIAAIWKEIGKNLISTWIPLLFFFTIPLISWSSCNNLLENTMSLFTLCAVLLFLISYRKKSFLPLFAAGLFLLFGFFTKGFTTFFPFCLPLFHWLLKREQSFIKMIRNTAIMLAGCFIPMAILFLCSDAAYSNTIEYLNIQVFNSIQSVATVNSRFFIIYKLFLELIPACIISGILLIYAWKRRLLPFVTTQNRNDFLLFLLLGACGVIPIMISMKQRGFYMLAAFPFFAIAFALITEPVFNHLLSLIGRRSIRWMTLFAILICSSGIVLSALRVGTSGRDREMLHDIHLMLQLIPEKSVVGITPEIENNWRFHAYLSRYKYISLSGKKDLETQFLIATDNDSSYENFQYLDLGTKRFFLNKRLTAEQELQKTP